MQCSEVQYTMIKGRHPGPWSPGTMEGRKLWGAMGSPGNVLECTVPGVMGRVKFLIAVGSQVQVWACTYRVQHLFSTIEGGGEEYRVSLGEVLYCAVPVMFLVSKRVGKRLRPEWLQKFSCTFCLQYHRGMGTVRYFTQVIYRDWDPGGRLWLAMEIHTLERVKCGIFSKLM